MKLIECVPNFSEGRDPNFINTLKSIVNNSEKNQCNLFQAELPLKSLHHNIKVLLAHITTP